MNTVIVAEIGINANGDLEIAKELIREACFAGCDFVKFQKRDIETVYTQEELNSERISKWGTTFREQKQGLEFNENDYYEIDKYCKQLGIGWFVSPWDIKSIEFIKRFKVPFIKVPSAKITDITYLTKVYTSDIPVILSTGMSTNDQVFRAIEFFTDDCSTQHLFYVLACTSTYPTDSKELNLYYIKTLKNHCYEDNIKVGFSNHSPDLLYCPMAVALGAEMIEFHITLDRFMEGSDQVSSIEPEGIRKIVKWIRGVEKALGDGKKRVYDSEKSIIKKLRRI